MKKSITTDGEIVDTLCEECPTPFFKTPWNYNRDAESHRTGLECADPSKAQQHQAEEADINTIVRRFNVTGQLPQIPLPPRLEEFGEIFDFQSAMNTMAAAKAAFAALPAQIRASFNNDPHAYVGYVDAALEAGDLDQLRKWGVALPGAPQPGIDKNPDPTPSPAGTTAPKP